MVNKHVFKDEGWVIDVYRNFIIVVLLRRFVEDA